MPTLSRYPALALLALALTLGVLLVVPGVLRLIELFGGPQILPGVTHYDAVPPALVGHILSAIPYALIAPLQIHWQLAPHKRGTLHRKLGPVAIALGAVMAATGLWAALTIPAAPGDSPALNPIRATAAAVMLATIALSLTALRHRNFPAHAAWALRSYALGMASLTQVLVFIPIEMTFDTLPLAAEIPLLIFGWTLNLMGVEWLIRRGRARAQPA